MKRKNDTTHKKDHEVLAHVPFTAVTLDVVYESEPTEYKWLFIFI